MSENCIFRVYGRGTLIGKGGTSLFDSYTFGPGLGGDARDDGALYASGFGGEGGCGSGGSGAGIGTNGANGGAGAKMTSSRSEI